MKNNTIIFLFAIGYVSLSIAAMQPPLPGQEVQVEQEEALEQPQQEAAPQAPAQPAQPPVPVAGARIRPLTVMILETIEQRMVDAYDKALEGKEWPYSEQTTEIAYQAMMTIVQGLSDLELLYDEIFCSLVLDQELKDRQNRPDIFVHHLIYLYNQNKESALAYFKNFCAEGRIDLFLYAVRMQNTNEALISSLLEIATADELDEIADALTEDTGPLAFQGGRTEPYVQSVLSSIEQRLKTIYEEQNKLQPMPTTFSPEAQKIIDASVVRPEKYAQLSTKQKEDFLTYLMLGYGVVNSSQSHYAMTLFEDLFIGDFVRPRPREQEIELLQQRLPLVLQLYTLFNKTYPRTKDLADTLSAHRLDPRTELYITLKQVLITLASLLIKKLLFENRYDEASSIAHDVMPADFKDTIFYRLLPINGERVFGLQINDNAEFISTFSEEEKERYYTGVIRLYFSLFPPENEEFLEAFAHRLAQSMKASSTQKDIGQLLEPYLTGMNPAIRTHFFNSLRMIYRDYRSAAQAAAAQAALVPPLPEEGEIPEGEWIFPGEWVPEEEPQE